MSVSVFNRCWSKVILETLVRQGVSHVCIAPGSRSTPLTLEAVRLQNAGSVTCHTHFDERGLGFLPWVLLRQPIPCRDCCDIRHSNSKPLSCHY